MAFPTKDKARSFGSAYKTKRYDEFHSKDEPKEAPEHAEPAEHEEKETPEFEKGEHEGAEENEGKAVVAEHGPARKVTITHDHKKNKHHVESEHEDGHRHLSEHETPEQAHEAGGSLANVSLKTSGEAGEQQGAASEGDNDHMDSFQMPPLV